MVLVKRGVLILFGIAVIIAIIVSGIYGYNLIRGAATPTSGMFDAAAAKGIAEDVLFATILVAVFTVVAIVAMIIRSRHVSRELEKIVEMSRYHDFSPEASLRRLGEIGAQLTAVYRHANAVSTSKSVKISALSGLNDFLVSNLPIPILVADATGTVLEVSRPMQERLELNRNELLGESFGKLVDDPQWNEVESELRRLRTPVSRKSVLGEITFYPIENRDSEVAYVVCSLEKPDRLHLVERSASKSVSGPARTSGLRGLLSGIRKQLDDRNERRRSNKEE
ncbi:MAG TPA: PAS domain-containing protein [Spirochaetia bacterium]|nr:PAS domain-containing protein [Spirochaetia bacterium]